MCVCGRGFFFSSLSFVLSFSPIEQPETQACIPTHVDRANIGTGGKGKPETMIGTDENEGLTLWEPG